jgi:hypothetical protein
MEHGACYKLCTDVIMCAAAVANNMCEPNIYKCVPVTYNSNYFIHLQRVKGNIFSFIASE